ncbi:MAG: hypothetical protein ACI8Z1_000725 [Candidatus Azotimanducaceae bacterium]|jgi:hypothetical protein
MDDSLRGLCVAWCGGGVDSGFLPALLLFSGGGTGVLIAGGALIGYLSLAAAACLPSSFISHTLATLISFGLGIGFTVTLLVTGKDLAGLLSRGEIGTALQMYSPLFCVVHYVSCKLFPEQAFQIKRLQTSPVL